MDAKEFIRHHNRMCATLSCSRCPLGESEGENFNCGGGLIPERIVDKVEKWAKENPIMTNRMKFKEVFGREISIKGDAVKVNGIIPEMKYFIEWLNAEYQEPKESKDEKDIL